MSTQKFKTGQTVSLISGGPTMTVRGYNNSDFRLEDLMVDVDWFYDKDFRKEVFHQDQLKEVDITRSSIPPMVSSRANRGNNRY